MIATKGGQGLTMVAASMREQTDAASRLSERLVEGIEAFVIMDEENGLDQQYKLYRRLQDNTR